MPREVRERRAGSLASILALALSAWVASGCAGSGAVTRVVHGRRVEGRYISSRAYARYLEAVVLETDGRLERAAGGYAEAAREDPANVDAWVRLGAVRCAVASTSSRSPSSGAPAPVGAGVGVRVGVGAPREDPWPAFERALRIDPTYEALWTEQARCHLAQRAPARAVEAGARAVALDPDSVEAASVLANALEAQGDRAAAWRWLDGLVVREPTSREAHHAVLDFARSSGDTARAAASRRALEELGAVDDRVNNDRAPLNDRARALRAIDEALASNDVARARTLARRAHVSDGALALRACALGRLAWARERAALVLHADANDSDARVALLVAADLGGDEDALARAIAAVPAQSSELSPLARSLLDELLARRIGRDAADPSRELPAFRVSGDVLLDAVRLRSVRSR